MKRKMKLSGSYQNIYGNKFGIFGGEKQGLKLSTISNKQELDEFEQNNIEKAVQWKLSAFNTICTIIIKFIAFNPYSKIFL
jgi:hypothetical protein